MAVIFCYDRMASDKLGYPNCVSLQADPESPTWQTFDHHWPRTVPLRLQLYLSQCGFPYINMPVTAVTGPSWYPIAFGWFDFSLDYLSLIPHDTLDQVRKGPVKILFYYHEGDNPQRIKNRLDLLCDTYDISDDRYVFVSANTAASQIPGCVYFQEHECFLRYRNRFQQADPANTFPSHEFLALNRAHKWWRATCMADLLRDGLLDQSLWSYNTDITSGDRWCDNPIEIDSLPGLRQDIKEFIKSGPYFLDSSDDVAHKDFQRINTNLFFTTHMSLILETQFDVDQSGGTFLTEKIFKAIKYGHPFVVIGPVGTLAQLRSDGYRVFDHVIDNSYDEIINNTQRWNAIKHTIMDIKQRGVLEIAKSCVSDVQHNKDLFAKRGPVQLNTLMKCLTR